MSKKIIQLKEGIIKNELKELVCSSVEETLKGLLEQEAQQLTNAAKYEQTEGRQEYRYVGWRILPKPCGAAKCLRLPSVS